MKARTTLIAAALAAATLTTLAAPAIARPFGGAGGCDGHPGMMSGGPGMMGGHGFERMARRLDLTKEQRSAARAIEDKYRPQMRELGDRLTDTRQALFDAKDHEAKVRNLADAQGKAMADMIVLRTRMQAEMDKVLTDAQREQLKQWRERGPRGQRG